MFCDLIVAYGLVDLGSSIDRIRLAHRWDLSSLSTRRWPLLYRLRQPLSVTGGAEAVTLYVRPALLFAAPKASHRG